jgi:hypothetical protein
MPGHGERMADRETQERLARNEATFREANERIEEEAEANELTERPIPFICECADPSCVAVLLLTLAEYRRVRSDARRFIVAPGHEAGLSESEPIEHRDGFDVVEKQGHAGHVAEELADG